MKSKNAANDAAKSSTISPAQLIANMANAMLSTGPKTPAGKAKSKMNALRHGLTGQFYVMNEPDRIAYTEFERGILRALLPQGEYEQQLATTIAQNHWRLNRARAIEYNNFGLGHQDFASETDADTAEVEAAITQAQTWLRDHPAITNLTLYETRIDRMITKNKRELDELRRERKAAEAAAREEAEKLLRLDLARSVKPDTTQPIQVNGQIQSGLIPTPGLALGKIEVNGFEFSLLEILAGLNRKDALEEANYYASRDWSKQNPWPGPKQTLPKAA